MRTKTLLIGLLASTLLLSTSFGFFGSQDPEPNPLQQAMGKMGEGKGAMRKLVRDPEANKAELLRACAALQEGTLAGFSLAPKAPEGVDAVEWRIGFQRTMLGVLDAALALELATLKGDTEGVAAAYKKIGEGEGFGHDTYSK